MPNGDAADRIADLLSAPLEELLVSLGRGIGRSQAELDRHAIEICLTESWCLPIDVDNADVMRPGKTDVLHVESMPVPPSSFDRVVLRSKGSDDTWRPSCIAVAVEGAVIHWTGSRRPPPKRLCGVGARRTASMPT